MHQSIVDVAFEARRQADNAPTDTYRGGRPAGSVYRPILISTRRGVSVDDEWDPERPVEIVVDGTLDLHTFSPRDVRDLVLDYLDACRARDILDVRVVHGKGTGTLRRTVHSVLRRVEFVESYGLADPAQGHWGATLIRLKPRSA